MPIEACLYVDHRYVAHSPDEKTDIALGNALLLAAAPDLLDACEGLLGLLRILQLRPDCSERMVLTMQGNHRVAKAHAAIAKATAKLTEGTRPTPETDALRVGKELGYISAWRDLAVKLERRSLSLEDHLKGMIGLLELLMGRDDAPSWLKLAKENHRFFDALELLEDIARQRVKAELGRVLKDEV